MDTSQEKSDIMVKIDGISFIYGGKTESTVKNFSLEVQKNSFTTLLGPSGCGKTTLLRLIAGFLEPTEGTIYIDGKNQRGVEPNKRKVGMVFQDYALFPHLTIAENIRYAMGFSRPRLSRDAENEAVFEIAKSLNIESLLDSRPSELSGGQQQRSALARSLVLKPKVLLMDEPLSSLDTKLRERVREELKEIQQQLKITTIYVTHDQDEALSLSDRIAVIQNGELLQLGSPHDIYFRPTSAFTADFVGRANFLQDKNGNTIMVRPEWLSLSTAEGSDCGGSIKSALFLGNRTRLIVENGAFSAKKQIIADIPTLEAEQLAIGQTVFLKIIHQCVL